MSRVAVGAIHFLCDVAGPVIKRPDELETNTTITEEVEVSFACECGQAHRVFLVRDYRIPSDLQEAR